MQKIIVAHRGASKAARENTLEAFGKAIQAGADMIELDVRRSRDGVLIVIHDPSLAGHRTAHTDYVMLERLAQGQGFHLPTLEEVLQLVQGKIKLDIELKESGFEARAMRTVQAYLPVGDFIVTSFHWNCLVEVKRVNPHIITGLILSGNWWKFLKAVLLVSDQTLARVDIVLPEYRRLAAARRNGKFKGKPFYIWTVDDGQDLEKFMGDPRIRAIITNVPERAAKAGADLSL